MGIHFRYSAAALILLFCFDAYSATRKTVETGQTIADIINHVTGGSFQTPNGEVGYFGRDYVDSHAAGRPGLDPVTPGASGGATGPARQKITLKPSATFNKSKLAQKALNLLKGGPGAAASVAATAALGWAINQIPGASFDPVTGEPVRVPDIDIVTSATYWTARYNNNPPGYVPSRHSSAHAACQSLFPTSSMSVNSSNNCIRYDPSSGQPYQVVGWASSAVLNCPHGINPSNFTCHPDPQPTPDPVPFTTSDDQLLRDAIASVQNSEWLRDLIKASCAGSLGPDACYQDLLERRQVTGPAQQLGPKVSTTQTVTAPNGQVTSTTTTTQNRYSYVYGDNYFDYSTSTRTETTTDGQTTVTETADNQLDGEEPVEEPSEDIEGSFQDSDFPDVEPFYEQKYPDGLDGVWQRARVDVDQSAFMQFLQGFIPSFSGSCPAFGLGFNIASWANYGTIQFSSICYVLDFVKIILLVTALFTFRKVTFGG